MRFCNFATVTQLIRMGVAVEDSIFPLDELLRLAKISTETTVASVGCPPTLTPENISCIDELGDVVRSLEPAAYELVPSYRPDEIHFLTPVDPVAGFRDFYAFEQHVKTVRARRGAEMVPEWYEIPVFYFSNHRTMIAHGQDLPFPLAGEWLDYELEVAAVIGIGGRDISPQDANEHIAGYAILNDWSLRDTQKREMKMNLGPAKGKDFATSLGPYLVTPDEIQDHVRHKGYDLEMIARVNGKEYSRGNWKDIHYSFAEMIARASQGVTLYPGEVIGSGTVGTGCILELGPETVGGWLKPGDQVELEIDHLGVLKNRIAPSGTLACA